MKRQNPVDGTGPEPGDVEAAIADTTIVIALKDDLRVLECLDSVDEDVEIVLVLNGTPSEVRRRVEAHPRKPQIVEIPDVGNLGAAYNAGIDATSRRFILLMDSDCIFAPGTIRTMAKLVTYYPVVKGKVSYGTAPGLISELIARIRAFDEGDYVSALSPPLLYDRTLARDIGGYHYDPLIHWCEDREFDFRLQMAGIPVLYESSAIIFHDAQVGIQDLRSYWRYGVGEAIGQRLGVFATPAIPLVWRMASDLDIVVACARAKGVAAGLYYVVTLCAFHAGTVSHIVADPFKVKHRCPATARRVRMVRAIPQHCTKLSDAHKRRLRAQHARAGHVIERTGRYQARFEQARAQLRAETGVGASFERVPGAQSS